MRQSLLTLIRAYLHPCSDVRSQNSIRDILLENLSQHFYPCQYSRSRSILSLTGYTSLPGLFLIGKIKNPMQPSVTKSKSSTNCSLAKCSVLASSTQGSPKPIWCWTPLGKQEGVRECCLGMRSTSYKAQFFLGIYMKVKTEGSNV